MLRVGASCACRRVVLRTKRPPQRPSFSTSSAPTIRSRRVFHKQQQQHSAKTESNSTSTSTPKPEDKGWPKSVRYTGYFLAVTAGPYSLLWLVANTPSLYNTLCTEAQRDWLRQQYGTLEEGAVSYVDAMDMVSNENHDRLPKILPREGTLKQRLLDKAQQELEQQELTIKVTLYKNHGDDQVVMEQQVTVPARVLARMQELKEYLTVPQTTTIDEATTVMAIDFVTEESSNGDDFMPLQDISLFQADETSSSTKDDDDNTNTSTKADPLLHQTTIYSTWYHHDPSTNATNHQVLQSSAHNTHPDQFLMDQLHADIQALQRELRSNNPMRDIDELQHELRTKQASLRRLKWKKWMPW